MIVTLAFQHKDTLPTFKDKIINFLIKWKTKSKYFHTEIIMKDQWISSSPAVGAVYIHPLKPLNDNFDYVEINIHATRVKKMLEFAKKQEGKHYDWLGILLSQTVEVDIENKNKWFCSELNAEMLKVGGIPIEEKSNNINPQDLYEIVTQISKV